MKKADLARHAPARPRWLEKACKVIAAMIAATTCLWPPPAHASEVQTALFEIALDSTRVVAVSGGREIISALELLYSLPDSVYAVEYGKAYYMPPRTPVSDRKPWRRLEKLAVAPDGGHVAVIANNGAGVDVLLKGVGENQLMVVGWWHHWGSDSLYWSPDSRYLLIALNGGENSKIILLEVTSDATTPVQQAGVWDSEKGWKFTGETPAWDATLGTATVSLQSVPTETSAQPDKAAAVTRTSHAIRFGVSGD